MWRLRFLIYLIRDWHFNLYPLFYFSLSSVLIKENIFCSGESLVSLEPRQNLAPMFLVCSDQALSGWECTSIHLSDSLSVWPLAPEYKGDFTSYLKTFRLCGGNLSLWAGQILPWCWETAFQRVLSLPEQQSGCFHGYGPSYCFCPDF